MAYLRQREMLTRRPALREAEPAQRETASAKPAAGDPRAAQLLDLQRRIGNQAVLQLMREGKLPALGRPTAPLPIQRTFRAKDKKLYSHADPEEEMVGGKGVITAVAAGSGFSHTIIYFEHKEQDLKIDLTFGGWGSSGSRSENDSAAGSVSAGAGTSGASGTASASGHGMRIDIVQPDDEDLTHLYKAGTKRSWIVKTSNLTAGLKKAEDIKDNLSDYVYKLSGTGLTFSRKKAMNCALFGEMILKAASCRASSGIIFKTPVELATGKKKFMK